MNIMNIYNKMDNHNIDLISIQKIEISNYCRLDNDRKKIPCLRFQFNYGGKDLFIFSCIFIEDKPIQYSISFESNPMFSLSDWRSQLTYAMKRFIEDNLIGKNEVILYSRFIIDVVSLIRHHVYGEIVDPGFDIIIKKEPKDIRGILLSIFK